MKNYWQNSNELTLGEMVNDILSTPNYLLEEYVAQIIQKKANKESDTKKENNDNLL